MTKTILVYGDSNSHGTAPMADIDDARRFDSNTRWPGVMAADLGPGFQVIEEALPGRTTLHDDPVEGSYRNGLTILPAILGSHLPLDLVIVMLGTNDLKLAFAMSPLEIAAGCDKLLRCILASESGPNRTAPKLLLIVPPPILETGCLGEIFSGGAAKSQRLPAEYAKIAARHNAALLDAGPIITSSPVDGIHFDEIEHGKLGHAVAHAVTALLQ